MIYGHKKVIIEQGKSIILGVLEYRNEIYMYIDIYYCYALVVNIFENIHVLCYKCINLYKELHEL